jgi:hypothetical protein
MKESIIRLLSQAIRQNPELRVGQLIKNIVDEKVDLFYLSDAAFEDTLRRYLKNVEYRRMAGLR